MEPTRIVVCPSCAAPNRVAEARLADGPTCGKCKQRLFTGHPVELDAGAFEAQVGRSDIPVVVDFWAPWCGPCKQFAPIFAQLAGQYVGRVRFAKVNTEAEQQLAGRHGIRSIPTLAMFKGGREVDRVAGALPPQQLQAWLARV